MAALDPARSVYLNCPFDEDYDQLFDAIFFATVASGFTPRSALESDDGTRMDRIARAIFDSRYSIHDLSRCTGEGAENFARLNMPIELGIAMGRKFAGAEHDWLILVPPREDFRKFASNLSAYDPAEHDGTVASVISAIMPWLWVREGASQTVTPSTVLGLFPSFVTAKDELARSWGKPKPPWPRLIDAARNIGLKAS